MNASSAYKLPKLEVLLHKCLKINYTSVNLCDVRNGTILRSSHSSKVKADSERQSQPSYLRLIITLWSISHRFRVISVFVWTENDVMPIFPLGGVVGQISRRILKGSIRLPIRY